MKFIPFFIIHFILLNGFVYSQDTTGNKNFPFGNKATAQPLNDSNHVFTVVDKMPEYPGGQPAMMAFIQKNLEYPEYARNNNLQGIVYATFIIDKKGKITDIKILRSMTPPCIACDSEVIRVIKKMPKWKPGMQQEKPVKVKFTLPVKFALQ
jgi:TonB family protein